MTENEKLTQITQTIVEFTQQFFHDLIWQAGQMIPGLDGKIAEATPAEAHANPLQYMMEPQEWLIMAKAAVGLLPNTEENRYYVLEICQGMAEWLFSIPGMSAYEIPDIWAEHPIGQLWWSARIWAEGDELITILEAAKIAGVTHQAIGGRIDRGKLKSFVNPIAGERQGRRLVRRSDVEKSL